MFSPMINLSNTTRHSINNKTALPLIVFQPYFSDLANMEVTVKIQKIVNAPLIHSLYPIPVVEFPIFLRKWFSMADLIIGFFLVHHLNENTKLKNTIGPFSINICLYLQLCASGYFVYSHLFLVWFSFRKERLQGFSLIFFLQVVSAHLTLYFIFSSICFEYDKKDILLIVTSQLTKNYLILE